MWPIKETHSWRISQMLTGKLWPTWCQVAPRASARSGGCSSRTSRGRSRPGRPVKPKSSEKSPKRSPRRACKTVTLPASLKSGRASPRSSIRLSARAARGNPGSAASAGSMSSIRTCAGTSGPRRKSTKFSSCGKSMAASGMRSACWWKGELKFKSKTDSTASSRKNSKVARCHKDSLKPSSASWKGCWQTMANWKIYQIQLRKINDDI